MSDYEKIANLLARYCHVVDREPAEAIADLFWDDAVLEFDGTFTGRDGIVRAYENWIAKMRDPVDELRHLVYAPAIQIDGDRATAETYFDADAVTRRSKRLVQLRGVYRDELARRGEQWRFVRREIVVLTPKA